MASNIFVHFWDVPKVLCSPDLYGAYWEHDKGSCVPQFYICAFPGSYVPQIYMAHNGNMTKGPMFPGLMAGGVGVRFIRMQSRVGVKGLIKVRLFDPDTTGVLMCVNRILNWGTQDPGNVGSWELRTLGIQDPGYIDMLPPKASLKAANWS